MRAKLVEIAREKPRFGYRRLHVLLQRAGEAVNRKRVYRVYREAGLCLCRKKRKQCTRVSAPLRQCTAANQEWALDFVHDAIATGRPIRVLSVVDAYTRDGLALEVDTSSAGRRVTRVLDDIIQQRGRPQAIRCENGPEPAFSGLVDRAEDRTGTYPAGAADAKRTLRKLQRAIGGRMPESQLVRKLVRRTEEDH